MKKIIALAIGTLMVLGLAACGNDSTGTTGNTSSNEVDGGAKNGTYTAQVDDNYAENAGNGWRDTLTVTFDNGAITDAKFDSIRLSDDQKKSEVDDENYPMDPPPSEWIPELNDQLKTGVVDGVAGATTASDNARTLLEAIENEGVEGEAITVTIPVDNA